MSHDASSSDAALRRLEAVRARIRAAAERAGRDPADVRIVAVSKTVSAERILELAAAGQREFGENRVQEGETKIPVVRAAWRGAPLAFRFIGHLQRNKVRSALELFERIDSIDSFRLLDAVSAEGVRRGRPVPALLQFNCSGERTKGGFEPDEVERVADAAARAAGVRITGLMTIARPADDPEEARPDFRRLRGIRDALAAAWGRELPDLSMGMSDDLDVAVEEGSTLVRVGTALFGRRPGTDPAA